MTTFTRNGKKLLYVPIDIEVELPPEGAEARFHHPNIRQSHCELSNNVKFFAPLKHTHTLSLSKKKDTHTRTHTLNLYFFSLKPTLFL
jgi:hypothetical protein